MARHCALAMVGLPLTMAVVDPRIAASENCGTSKVCFIQETCKDTAGADGILEREKSSGITNKECPLLLIFYNGGRMQVYTEVDAGDIEVTLDGNSILKCKSPGKLVVCEQWDVELTKGELSIKAGNTNAKTTEKFTTDFSDYLLPYYCDLSKKKFDFAHGMDPNVCKEEREKCEKPTISDKDLHFSCDTNYILEMMIVGKWKSGTVTCDKDQWTVKESGTGTDIDQSIPIPVRCGLVSGGSGGAGGAGGAGERESGAGGNPVPMEVIIAVSVVGAIVLVGALILILWFLKRMKKAEDAEKANAKLNVSDAPIAMTESATAKGVFSGSMSITNDTKAAYKIAVTAPMNQDVTGCDIPDPSYTVEPKDTYTLAPGKSVAIKVTYTDNRQDKSIALSGYVLTVDSYLATATPDMGVYMTSIPLKYPGSD